MINFKDFINESYISNHVKKGDKVNVKMMCFEGKPEFIVEAYNDSWYNEKLNTESFSFLNGGDMMRIAKWNGQRWICD